MQADAGAIPAPINASFAAFRHGAARSPMSPATVKAPVDVRRSCLVAVTATPLPLAQPPHHCPSRNGGWRWIEPRASIGAGDEAGACPFGGVSAGCGVGGRPGRHVGAARGHPASEMAVPPQLVQDCIHIARVAGHPEDLPDFPGYNAAVADSIALVVDVSSSGDDENGDEAFGFDEEDLGGVDDD
ncbi:hypothetical protein ZWY2020_033440 [Hordeum vulgare]|nr:hypothetical protein ZWY2020_033440 [Hordeum vulgare]